LRTWDAPRNASQSRPCSKAAKKLNPEVFSDLTLKFSELFYRSHLVKKYRGYLLLAEDGTTLEIPKSRQSLDEFGYVENQSTVKGDSYIHKANSSHSAILYDVTNGIAVDFLMRPFRYSEIPLAIEHLNRTDAILHGQKIVYLADRYYDSAELFRLLELRGCRYCVRAKSNMFKHQVAAMKSDDEWITVVLNGQWLKRLKYEQARESFMKDPVLHVRVVKYRHRSVDRATGEIKETELTYFTDLDEKEFSSEEIAALYAKRWDIEVSYKSLKSGYELERYFSNDCSIARCAVCAKVLYHNLVGVIRKEMDRSLSKKRSHTEYAYAVNITQLNDHIRKNNLLYMIFHRRRSGIIGLINDVIGLADKIKVPVPPRQARNAVGQGHICEQADQIPYRWKELAEHDQVQASLNDRPPVVKYKIIVARQYIFEQTSSKHGFYMRSNIQSDEILDKKKMASA